MSLAGRIFFLSFLLLNSGCITVRTETDILLWYRDQQVIGKLIAEEQRSLRKNVRDTKINAPFFWEISKDGKKSWLLGTMHQGVALGELPRVVRTRLINAKTVVLESSGEAARRDFKKIDISKYHKAQKLAVTPLSESMGPYAWEALKWDLFLVPPTLLDRFSPAGARNFYLETRSEVFTSSDLDHLDQEVENEAKKTKIKLEYLEELKDVIGLLMGGEEEAKPFTARDLSEFILGDPIAEVKQHIAKNYSLTLIYKKGNLEELFKELPQGEEFYDPFIKQRNQAWLPKLEKILIQGNAFVAVGAGHMTGPDSLIKLLKNRGFKVERWRSGN